MLLARAQPAQVAQALRVQPACDWVIPPPPHGETLDPAKVNVNYTPTGMPLQTIVKVTDQSACGTSQGWYYDNPMAPTKIISCPTTCETYRSAGGKIDIVFGCTSIIPG